MTKEREALKMALEALNNQFDSYDWRIVYAIQIIEEALAQPEQEPVAAEFWLHQCRKKPELQHLSFNRQEPELASKGYEAIPLGRVKEALAQPDHIPDAGKLVTKGVSLPEREWVGLTDKQIQAIHDTYYKRMGFREFHEHIEAKLKELNHGL